MSNLPIYRAKKLYSDEYVEGWLLQDFFGYYMIPTNNALRCESLNSESIEIDPTTLSIHFPDMIDSQGNKIFASLQEFGAGGDIITDGEYDFVVIFNGRSFDLMFVEDNTFTKFNEWDDWDKFAKKGVNK